MTPKQVTDQVEATVFNVGWKNLDDEMLPNAAQHGIPVAIYTVNSEDRMRELIDAGAAALCTDRPDLMLPIARP